MVKIQYTEKYRINLQKLLTEFPTIGRSVDVRIRLFEKNPADTRLRNHKLRKRLEGKWAFSIDDDIRIIYEWRGDATVRFLAINRHEIVYTRPS